MRKSALNRKGFRPLHPKLHQKSAANTDVSTRSTSLNSSPAESENNLNSSTTTTATSAVAPSVSSSSISLPKKRFKRPLVPSSSGKSGLLSVNVKRSKTEEENKEKIDESANRCFEVLWCKFSRKKHKSYADGILVSKGRLLVLMDPEGKDLSKTTGYSVSSIQSLKVGNTVDFGGKEIEISNIRPYEDYSSGRVFCTTTPAPHSINSTLTSSLSMRKKFKSVTKGQKKAASHASSANTFKRKQLKPLFNPDADDALVLYTPLEGPSIEHDFFHSAKNKEVAVVVDPHIARLLRPHQREGVCFLYRCLTQQQEENFSGCILADEMGLGKTVQTIATMHTLLQQSKFGKGDVRKAVVVTPSSLVDNWKNEFKKWLGIRLQPSVIGGNKENSSASNTKKALQFFSSGSARVLIISYGMFRANAVQLQTIKGIDLIVCDEGHKLKGGDSKINAALSQMSAKKRLILSGTPVQNELRELFELLNFVCPGILGTLNSFQRVYEKPILLSREPSCPPHTKEEGKARSEELARRTNKFILRRTADVNRKYLPPRVEQVLFVRLSNTQIELYKHCLSSKTMKGLLGTSGGQKAGATVALDCLMCMQKLCNHPALVLQKAEGETGVFANSAHKFPAELTDGTCQVEFSGKMVVAAEILRRVKEKGDKIVVVSNYTSTLNLLEMVCKEYCFSSLRLDGSVPSSKRMALVDRFNGHGNEMVFLLSSKAGGVGLNLIGANRILMFDPDWNPANDLQAMARVWREGQKKTVYIYRLISTGTVEEKIFQRQVMKTGLSRSVVDERTEEKRLFSLSDTKRIFNLNLNTPSDTHDMIQCKCHIANQPALRKTKKLPHRSRLSVSVDSARAKQSDEDDLEVEVGQEGVAQALTEWEHHFDFATIADPLLRDMTLEGAEVSCIFSSGERKYSQGAEGCKERAAKKEESDICLSSESEGEDVLRLGKDNDDNTGGDEDDDEENEDETMECNEDRDGDGIDVICELMSDDTYDADQAEKDDSLPANERKASAFVPLSDDSDDDFVL